MIKFDNIETKFYKTINSTNDEAKVLVKSGIIKLPTLIYADVQTNGRGRFNHTWNSKNKENIYMTLIIPDIKLIDKISRITILVGVIIANILNEKLESNVVKIKWVNDIFVYNRKLGGILTEVVKFNDNYYLIIGIGINIKLEEKDLENNLKNIAISLNQIKKEACFSKEGIIKDICSRILKDYESYKEDKNFANILNSYKDLCITIGNNVSVKEQDSEYECFAEDINEEGNLVVKLPNGERKVLISGDVRVGVSNG